MNSKIVKESFIILLLFIVIMFCLGILFYDSMSVNTEDIVSIEYKASDNVNNVLTEIQSNSGVDVTKQTSNSILQSYSIGAEDLTVYASDNSYESGKKDPFAESSETIEEVVTTTSKTGTASNSQTSNPVKIENTTVNKQTNTEVKNDGNTVKSTVQNTVQNRVTNTVSKEKNESSVGTFFENKNSK